MAKIPIILEAGRADGKLATSCTIFDENKGMFQSEINDIQDTLNSDNPNKPLSAKQGKVLKELLNSKVIEVGAVPIDTEPTEGNITHVVNSDGLAKEFNKCNTTIINTDRIANEAIIPSKLSVDIQNLITNLNKTATFAGIATPTTDPGTPDGPVFYIATTAGSYSNFGNIEISKGESAILKWNNGAWTKSSFKPMTDFNSVFDTNGNSLTHALDTLGSDIFALELQVNGLKGNIFTIRGKRYNPITGFLIDDSTMSATKLLPLSEFENYKIFGIRIKSGLFRMYGESQYCVAAFFDESKALIGVSHNSTVFSPVSPFPASEIPNGTKFIAFTGVGADLSVELITTDGIAEAVKKDVSKVTDLDLQINGYPSKLFTTLGYRYTTDGSLISFSNAGTTDIIPLSFFGDYKNNGIRLLSGTFRMYATGNYCLAVFFDSAKTFVGFSQYSQTLSPVSPFPASEIPSNAEYIAFTGLDYGDLFDIEFVVYDKGVVGDVDKVKGDIVDINNSIASTTENLETLREDVNNGFGGVIKGFDVFSAENVFTIKGKARNKDTGEEYDYVSSNISPLMYLEYLRNSEGNIELIQGQFRGSSLGVAFFFDANGEYIGYDGSTTTYSVVSAFPSSLIPAKAVYVSFLQYNNQSSVKFYTYSKPISKYDDLKIRMGIIGDYPIVVTPNMTPKAFYEAIDAQMNDFASVNKTYKESFFYVLTGDFTYTWENVLSIVSKNLRQDIGDVNTPMNIVCDNVNKALTEKIYRFYDAKPLSNAERDASLTTGLNKGEPSVIISDDGGTMYIYGNGKRINTTDGVKWTEPIDIVKSDSGHTLHESVNYIDGVYYLIAPRQNSGGALALYTSTDGIYFTLKGDLFANADSNDVVLGADGYKIVSWGNPYLVKEYSTNKYYLYIETQDYIDDSHNTPWRIHLVIFDDLTTQNADGTIGRRTISDNNPVITKPFLRYSKNGNGAGNPDFFKGMDNRPVKVGNKYYMMFHSTHLAIAHLFRASSYDLIHWDIDGIMWDNRDKPSGGDKTSGNADACVIEFKGRTYLFYTHDINQEEKGIEHIKYTIDDRPLSELLKLYP